LYCFLNWWIKQLNHLLYSEHTPVKEKFLYPEHVPMKEQKG